MAFSLIVRNALRISAVSIVSQIVLFIGKIFITVASTLGGKLFYFHCVKNSCPYTSLSSKSFSISS